MEDLNVEDKNFEILEEEVTECGTCPNKATLRTFVLRDSRPYKLVCVKDCPKCGTVTGDQNDYESLEYSVKITCDFTKLSPEEVKKNLRRMSLINNKTLVTIFINEKEVVTFLSDKCEVDSLQGLLMRINDTVATGNNSEEYKAINAVLEVINKVMEGTPFSMTIVDDSGFSRVCPFGIEYTDMQDKELEEFNDEMVIHEKHSKAIS